MTTRILVTGGNGRLGQAVLAALGDRGVPGMRRDGGPDAVFIDSAGRIDARKLSGIEAIINCAGQVAGAQAEIDRANVCYPITLALAARAAGVKRFVQVSSFSVFGKTEWIDAGSTISPDSAYGRSKAAAERELRAMETDSFHVTSLRLPFMFSAAQPALLGLLISLMLRLRALPTPSSGPSRRSMITYAGAADALVALALTPDVPDGNLAAADPAPLELPAIARAIHKLLGKRILLLPVPDIAAALVRPVAPRIVDRLLRSSVLAPSANVVAAQDNHRVQAELIKYLEHLRS